MPDVHLKQLVGILLLTHEAVSMISQVVLDEFTALQEELVDIDWN